MCWGQLLAICKVRYLEKRRNLPVTCCEYLSHFIILLLLVMGFGLSLVEYFPATVYTPLSVYLPPPALVPESNSSAFVNAIDSLDTLLQGPLIIPDLNTYLTLNYALSSVNGGSLFDRILTETSVGGLYGNLFFKGDLHFAPEGELLDSLLDYINRTTPAIDTYNVTIITHASESAGVDYIMNNLESRALALVVLKEITLERVKYKIRVNYTTLPNTNTVYNYFSVGLDVQYQSYFLSGFLSVQNALDAWVYEYLNMTQNAKSECQSGFMSEPNGEVFAPFPTYAYSQNPFYTQVGFLLGLAMIMATLYPMSRLVKSIVEEKETRLKEIMKVMGLRDFAHQLSWMITGFIVFFWIAITTTYVCANSFLPNSNPVLLFAFFFLFCMSELTMSLLLSCFFSNSKLAAIVAPVVLFASLLPRYIFFTTNSNEAATSKFTASLLSSVAFSFGADYISDAEYTDVGIQFSNIHNGTFSFASCLNMMFVDCILYLLLAYYFDLVIPQEFGTPLPFWFPLSPYYWCGSWLRSGAKERTIEPVVLGDNDEKLTELESENIKIIVSHLFKQYSSGVVAVNDLSFSMIENQITCLLGHNGAGKSTTISIMIGLIHSSFGHCNIYGLDVNDELSDVRQLIGVCPQQNVIFPTLTVGEHLYFFARIKGLSGKSLETSVTEIIASVGLTEKVNAQSSTLSGGMKRKLCLAMALVGNPKFVLLDEPTSGMDPYSRRSTWAMLEKKKHGKCMLLTTHFMDEADTLGDRILIMSHGQLQCSGSSLFLKSRFGVGYVLTCVKKIVDGQCNYHELQPRLVELIPEMKLERDLPLEIAFNLPIHCVNSFPRLFNYLKDNAANLGILSYGLSITSLEQVFIRLAAIQLPKSHSEENDKTAELFNLNAVYGEILGSIIFSCIQMWRYFQIKSVYSSVPTRNTNDTTTKSAEMVVMQSTAVFDSDNAHAVPAPGLAQEVLFAEEKYIAEESVTGENGGAQEKAYLLVDIYAYLYSCWRNSFVMKSIIVIQLSQLLWKRVIIVKRDLKGFFFQVIFPSLQILAITAILSIRYNPAGNTLNLAGFSYEDKGPITPSVISAGQWELPVQSELVDTLVSRPYLKMGNSTDQNSTSLSYSFLDQVNATLFSKEATSEIFYNNKYRMGAYIFEDSLPVNVTIAWDDVKEILSDPAAGNLSQFVGSVLTQFGIDDVSYGPVELTLPSSVLAPLLPSIPSFNISDFLNITALLNLLPVIVLNATVVNDFIVNLLDSFNITVSNNILDNIAALFPSTQVSGESFSITPLAGFTSIERSLLSLPMEDSPSSPLYVLHGTFFDRSIFHVIGETQSNMPNYYEIDADEGYDYANYRHRRLQTTPTIAFTNVTVDITSISYDFGTNLVTLSGVTLIVYSNDTGPIVLDVGNTSFPLNLTEIVPFLPNGTISYLTQISNIATTVLHNTSSPHAVAIFHGELIRSKFQYCAPTVVDPTTGLPYPDLSNSPEYIVQNFPLPITPFQSLEIQVILALFTSLFMLVPLCYIPAAFVTFVVQERAVKSKHLQIVNGVSPYLYWISTYIWDTLLYLVLACFIAIMMNAYTGGQSLFFSTLESGVAIVSLLVLYGISAIPLAYLYSFGFSNHSTAQISITVINFMTGFVMVLAYFIMVNVPSTVDTAKLLVPFFRVFPSYNVGEGLINLSTTYYLNNLLGENTKYLSWDVAGRNVFNMGVEACCYFAAVLISESSYFKRFWREVERQRLLGIVRVDSSLLTMKPIHSVSTVDLDEPGPFSSPETLGASDEDVLAEGIKADETSPEDCVLLIKNLTKTYPPPLLYCGSMKRAVKGISICLGENERFGLLGINGAGKTTTIDILTGDTSLTSGEVFIGGKNLNDPSTQRMIGYCPQTDPILELMTGRETLWLFAKTRGFGVVVREMERLNPEYVPVPISKEQEDIKLTTIIDHLIVNIGLKEYADKRCGTYSGGNKRKLSLAIALIGNPALLLLDEPSSGMDPVSRRAMWNVISEMSRGRTVILTTHSMEECESLCTRIGIMVSGGLRCIGSAQHIKDRFGAGYEIEIRCSRKDEESSIVSASNTSEELSDGDLQGIKNQNVLAAYNACKNTIPLLSVSEYHEHYIRLEAKSVNLAAAFEVLEALKSQGIVMDYSISQSTLEQIFIQFARKQEEEVANTKSFGII